MVIQDESKYPRLGGITGARLFFLFLVGLICSSCRIPTSKLPSLEAPTTPVTPTATEAPEEMSTKAWNDWKSGPHSAAYDLSKGPNSYCARCHSPLNWDRNAKIDPPPNCVSCKFDFEESPRSAVGNPLISEEEWKGIGCDVCHRVENGVTDPKITWYDQLTGYYETVTSSNQLCGKCHTDTETLKHKMDLGDGAHSDFTCTDCHQPHTASANCSAEGCHSNVTFSEEIDPDYPGHTVFHKSIYCIACHDASGLDVGPLEGQETWMTFRTTELLGRTQTAPHTSHHITKEASCERCHFPNNPWEIPASVSE